MIGVLTLFACSEDPTTDDPWAGVWLGEVTVTWPDVEARSGATLIIDALADGRYFVRRSGVHGGGSDVVLAEATADELSTEWGLFQAREADTAVWSDEIAEGSFSRVQAAFDVSASGPEGDWLLESASQANTWSLTDTVWEEDGSAAAVFNRLDPPESSAVSGIWSAPRLSLGLYPEGPFVLLDLEGDSGTGALGNVADDLTAVRFTTSSREALRE